VVTSFTAQPTIYTLHARPHSWYLLLFELPAPKESLDLPLCPAHYGPSSTAEAAEEEEDGQSRAGPAQEYKRSRAAAHLVVDVTVQ